MRRTFSIILLGIIIFTGSCSKQGSNTYVRTNYNCHCYWYKSPTKDTTADYPYQASDMTQAQAQSACDGKDKWAKSLSGKSTGAYCRLE